MNAYKFSEWKTSDYPKKFRDALAQHDREITAILDNPAEPTFANTIEPFEHSGKQLSEVEGIFFNLVESDSTDELQKIEEEVSPLLTEHGNRILANRALFQRIKTVYDNNQSSIINNQSEHSRLLWETYDSFASNGANLGEEDSKKLQDINRQLSLLSIRFSNNALKAKNAWTKLITDEQDLQGIPANAVQMMREKALDKGQEGWLLDLQPTTYGPVMQFADSSDLRHELWQAHVSCCCTGGELDNHEIVRQIINLRLQKANLLGYPTYADYALRNRMAKTPAGVYDLLHKLTEAYLPVAKRERAELQTYANAHGYQGRLQRWDISYWSEKMRQDLYNISSEEFRPYLPLEEVKRGVFGLATQLYGIRFCPNTEVEVYHPEVTAYNVLDQDGSFLGLLYTDFHPRESKRSGAWMSNFREQQGAERPHVVIVMNLTKPLSDKPALLTLGEVNTFLHEFGHALHGLLTRCHYQSLSGTNVARDFVELPSQIMENFTDEAAFLHTFARHYETGEPLPDELLARLKKARNYNAATACIGQLVYATLDMAWHSITEPYTGDMEAFEEAAKAPLRITDPQPDEQTVFFSACFSHLFSGGYAAGYYSYKWSEMLDTDAFEVFKDLAARSDNPFEGWRQAATRFRHEILERGDTLPARDLYLNYRGQQPSITALLHRDGINK